MEKDDLLSMKIKVQSISEDESSNIGVSVGGSLIPLLFVETLEMRVDPDAIDLSDLKCISVSLFLYLFSLILQILSPRLRFILLFTLFFFNTSFSCNVLCGMSFILDAKWRS